MKWFENSNEIEGIGGWLALFQVRMYMGLVALLVLGASPALVVLFVAVSALCMTLFYLRRMAFRAVYVVAAVLSIVVAIAALPVGWTYLIVQLVLEAMVIPALYRSKRVKNTFIQRRYAFEACGRRYDGYDRNCYDIHLATYRCAR